jgi:hypothetical protein
MAERAAPAMYMLWPQGRPMPEIPSIPTGYNLSVIASEDIDRARGVVEIRGSSAIPSGTAIAMEWCPTERL